MYIYMYSITGKFYISKTRLSILYELLRICAEPNSVCCVTCFAHLLLLFAYARVRKTDGLYQ